MSLLQDLIDTWISCSEDYWELDILDTQPGYAGDIWDITDIFVIIGWQWYLNKYGVGGHYVEHNAKMSHTMKWCGAGVAAAGRNMFKKCGYRLKESVASICMPSTYRLFHAEFWERAGVSKPEPLRRIRNMKRGDLATLGHSKSYGDHIAQVTSTHLTHFRTIEYNAVGATCSKGRKEGVVRKSHKYSEVSKVYRPTLAWFEKVK